METRYEQMRPGYVDKKKDEAPSAIRRERAVIEKLIELMSDIRPFSSDRDPSHLVSLSSGIIDSEGKCDPEKTLEIGEKIQNGLDGKPYTTSLERKYVITNLATLKPTVKVGGKKIECDVLQLFTRLAMIGERKCGIKTCLKFELTKVPLALYEADGGVRKRDKSELGRYFRDRLQNVVLRDP